MIFYDDAAEKRYNERMAHDIEEAISSVRRRKIDGKTYVDEEGLLKAINEYMMRQ